LSSRKKVIEFLHQLIAFLRGYTSVSVLADQSGYREENMSHNSVLFFL